MFQEGFAISGKSFVHGRVLGVDLAGGGSVPRSSSGRKCRADFSWVINWQASQSLRCEPTYPPFSERRC